MILKRGVILQCVFLRLLGVGVSESSARGVFMRMGAFADEMRP